MPTYWVAGTWRGRQVDADSMNTHALGVLQFDQVLDVVAGHASSSLGAAAVRELPPSPKLAIAEAELSRVSAMKALMESEAGWEQQAIPDVGAALTRLKVEGTTLSGSELRDVTQLMRSSRLTRSALNDEKQPAVARATLESFARRLLSEPRSEDAVAKAIDENGEVKDDASHELRKIRRELRSAQSDLVALLERVMNRLEPHQRVTDASVTMRNGRFVIPVRREARGVVGGLVHDVSGSGATLFVEPPAAIEACNRIRELEAAELHEVDRILGTLTAALRPLASELTNALDALVVLDTLGARARYAIRYNCQGVRLRLPGTGFRILNGRHPLLMSQGVAVVPFDLTMEPDERTLLISGPNTGGKTVLLKALALISAMVQAGVPAPVALESEIPVYDDVFADIGDEQSIEASLSTFSAHLRNLAEILRAATQESLVVIDELGSGTDPLEGAALGGAILEALTARGSMTVATTHLGALKDLAAEVKGVVNASLEFDSVALAPTYRLIKGIPGRSYGLSIARRLELPEAVLSRAEERVPKVERDANALLQALEARDREMASREAEVAQSTTDLQQRAQRLAEREQKLRARERAVEKESRADARRYLLEARHEIEATIRELRKSAEAEADNAARAARQKVESLVIRQNARLDQLDREESNRARTHLPPGDKGPLRAGQHVEVIPLEGRRGRVIEVREDDIVVALGAIKVAYPRSALRRLEDENLPAVVVPMTGDLPEVAVATEIDLRGKRVDELDEPLLQAIDAAIRADLHSLRIIHGKGTGALRERVGEMLRKDTRVRAFRLGLWNEGGAGVTMVDL